MGGFTSFFERLFPRVVLNYVSQDVFNNENRPIIFIQGCKFGPYPTSSLIWAETFLGWGGCCHDRNRVVLVERGFSPIDLPAHCKINRNDTGIKRRRLYNQSDVNSTVQAICDRFKFPLSIVQLEHLSIEDQQPLFNQAVIVIGQHGAGLCNI